VYPWDDDDYVWAQVYKNGSPHGTRRTHTSIKTTTYTEDLSFDAGDIFAICIYSTGGGAGIGIQDVFIMSGAKPMVQGGSYDSPDF